MIKVSSAEFQRNIGRYQDLALTQPSLTARPRRFYAPDGRSRVITSGGLIPSGPLAFTQFVDGDPVPLGTGSQIIGTAQVGGGGPDLNQRWAGIRPADKRHSAFLHYQHQFADEKTAYIQLMQGSSARASQNRVQEITEITTGLKALGKELGVPIIALSQLSRQVESRDDKRPQLSDLRESGSIEQDADVVLFVYREEYYLRNKEPKPGTLEYTQWETEMNEARGKAEVIIAKQRHGPTGTVGLAFQGEFTRFSDLAEGDHLPERYE